MTKNKGGRPPKYTKVEEVEAIIEEYFKTDAYIGEGDNRQFAPTMSGLAFALNLSRQGLIDYGKKEQFFDTIKKARDRVAIALEQRLYGHSVTGIIFNLKNNFGWKDKQDIEHSGQIGLADKTEEELNKRLEELEREMKGGE